MDDKQVNFLYEIKRIYAASRNIATGIFRLAGLETQLAVKSMGAIICLSLLLFLVVACFWFWLVVLGITYFMTTGISLLVCLLTVVIIHAILAIVFVILLLQRRQDMSFAATKKQIRLSARR